MRGLKHYSWRCETRPDGTRSRLMYLAKAGETPKGPGGHLRSREAVTELRDVAMPDFMAWAGIRELTHKGFRMIVEIGPPGSPLVVQLITGTRVAPQNPQDWLSAAKEWDPNGPARFFDAAARAARQEFRNMEDPFHNLMFYAGREREVFGVVDGDPKSETHFLVLAAEPFQHVMDPRFTADYLIKYFETAYQICEEMGISGQHIRFVTNVGSGFQEGARVHMHGQSARAGLPSMSPAAYGFGVDTGGVIIAPPNSERHGRVITLIESRKEPGADKSRIDRELLAVLEELKSVESS
ncbi:HIT domain-containing protein [Candidatus Margulisiibacteriota bacterium]